MDNYQLTQDQITAYGVCLRTEEHTPSTSRNICGTRGLLPCGWRAAR